MPSLAREDLPALEGCASRERQHCEAEKGGKHCGQPRHSESHAAHPSRLPAFGNRSSHQKVPSSAANYTTTDYPYRRMVGCTTCSPPAQVPTFSRRIDAPLWLATSTEVLCAAGTIALAARQVKGFSA